jgi:hypothetical protein
MVILSATIKVQNIKKDTVALVVVLNDEVRDGKVMLGAHVYSRA